MHIETLITRLPNDTIYVRMIIRIEVALYAIQGAGPNSVILDFRLRIQLQVQVVAESPRERLGVDRSEK